MMDKPIETVGKLGATYGVRGWLRLYSSTQQAESIFAYQPWFLKVNNQWQAIELEAWRYHNHHLIVKLKGISDRKEAALKTNCEIGVGLDSFPALSDDDFYWHDLMGCSVINQSGYQLGVVKEMMETGSNDVLVVRTRKPDAFGKQERLIPFILDTVIKRVDLNAKEILVEWDADF